MTARPFLGARHRRDHQIQVFELVVGTDALAAELVGGASPVQYAS